MKHNLFDIMKQSEIKELSVAELQEKLGEVKKSYSDLKLAHAISPLENPIQLRGLRRTVARIATELTKREQ
ncbi:50S ribosomal protein L29 [Gaetbulibacter aestuarii]